jgi:Histidine-specific methyltransferase, SAM-dependent
MMPQASAIADAGAVTIDWWLNERQRALAEDVLDGLTRPFKELPPKHFYDAQGAALFERICDLPEYFPARTERALLGEHAAALAASTGAVEIVELGSGSAAKTGVLLDAFFAAGTLECYVPLDVTERAVRDCAAALVGEYPRLRVHGVIGDLDCHLHRVPPPDGPRLVIFLGGTIGNCGESRCGRCWRPSANSFAWVERWAARPRWRLRWRWAVMEQLGQSDARLTLRLRTRDESRQPPPGCGRLTFLRRGTRALLPVARATTRSGRSAGRPRASRGRAARRAA